MMLETLLDASAGCRSRSQGFSSRKLQTLAAELEELTQAVERRAPSISNPANSRLAVA